VPSPSPRRDLLTRGLLLAAGLSIGTIACSTDNAGSRPSTPPEPRANDTSSTDSARPRSAGAHRILLAYFSRAGENYYNGGRRNLAVGNTQVVAETIKDLVDCDVHRIEPAEPYPQAYDATVARNKAEQDADARPRIANPIDSITDYDTVLLGSPIWNVRAPMIMSTFTDAHDFAGRRIYPFVTYAVSGLAGVDDDYATACPDATIGPGLAVRGEEAARSRRQVRTWLREIGLSD
jgi:flavodoxin